MKPGLSSRHFTAGPNVDSPAGWAEKSVRLANKAVKEWWWKGQDITPGALKNYNEFLAHVIVVNLRMANEQGTNPGQYQVDHKAYTK